MNARKLYVAILLSAGLLPGILTLAQADDQPAAQSESKSKARAADEGKSKAETFSIDPTHSMAMFRVRHGASMFWGRFNKLTGTVSYNAKSDSGLELDVTMAIDSVDSGSERLDGHLKSEDFFFMEEHPEATFKSSSSKKVGENTYEVSGKLTMRGVTKPIKVNVDWLGTSESRRGQSCGLETAFTVKRSEFGIDYGVSGGMLGNETKIIVAIEGKAGGDGPGRRAGGQGAGGLPGFLARSDANGDGKIQKSEAPERLKGRFDELDTNGDGAIDAAEAGAMRGGRRGGRGQRPNSDG
jgi:polyisoprenoid-binding protein YceI